MSEFTNEFEATEENVEMEENLEQDGSKEVYTLKDGSEGTRAAYIRELFTEDNLSRKEIAELTGFPYRIVYSATVNMSNEANPAGRGRSVTNPIIQVYGEDNMLVKENEEGTFFDAVTGEEVDGELVKEVSRNEWIQEKVGAGAGRGDIATQLDLSYGVIYNLTKDQEGSKSKHVVELEDGSEMPRAEYIRQQYADGKSRSDIAKELDVQYAVVWQATRVEKSDADKFAELVDQLKEYQNKVSDPDGFEALMAELEEVTIAEEVEA